MATIIVGVYAVFRLIINIFSREPKKDAAKRRPKIFDASLVARLVSCVVAVIVYSLSEN